MVIGIYADPLRIFTSAMPQRGLIKQMIKEQREDTFVFFLHKKVSVDPVIVSFFDEMKAFRNWEVSLLSMPYKMVRIIQLIGFEYPRLNKHADVYFSSDTETFGKRRHPLINYLPDMSVFDDPDHTSLSRLNNLFRKRSISRMSKASDCIIVISRFTAERFAAHFPGTKHKLKLVYNGIDENWFSLRRQPVNNGKKYWAWMGGSYNSRKNLDRLLHAYRQLLLKLPDREIPGLVFAGLNEDSITRLQEVLDKMSLTSQVSLKPKIKLEALVQLVDNSEGLLFPSIYEGFGLPVIEAFARGKAVLTADKTSLTEIADGRAILCNPYEIDSICDGLLKMLNPEENEEIRVNSRKKWASNFTYSVAADKLYAIFKEFDSKKNALS